MELGLKGKVVLCMHSASGLGKGIATEMAREGAKVMMCVPERYKERLYAARDEIAEITGNRPEVFFCDMTRAEEITALVEHTVNTLGDIYALVNMGPGPEAGPFSDFDDAGWQKAFELCLLSYIRTIRACIPSMKRLGGGRIINSTSSSSDCAIKRFIIVAAPSIELSYFSICVQKVLRVMGVPYENAAGAPLA